MEPIHKEGSKNNLAKQSETRVHSFNHKPHNFVNSSSHKLNVKRSLHKLETINCIYTNADCLTNKINELRLLVRNHKLTIVGITEVKPNIFRYDLADAEVAIGCNLQNKTGRGVALYIRDNIQANPVDFSSEFSESVWLSTKLAGGDELLIGCVYRSSSGTDENNENLLKLLSEIKGSNFSHILIMGDFNFERIIKLEYLVYAIIRLLYRL